MNAESRFGLWTLKRDPPCFPLAVKQRTLRARHLECALALLLTPQNRHGPDSGLTKRTPRASARARLFAQGLDGARIASSC